MTWMEFISAILGSAGPCNQIEFHSAKKVVTPDMWFGNPFASLSPIFPLTKS